MNLRFHILARIKNAWGYRREPEEMHFLLSLYWRLLLLVVVILAACALIFGARELSAVAASENPGASMTPVPPPAITTEQIENTLGAFAQKQSEYQSLAQSPAPPVADPSR